MYNCSGDYRDAHTLIGLDLQSYLTTITPRKVIIILKHYFSKWPPRDFLMFVKKKQVK